MFFSAKHIGIKLDQDYADFREDSKLQSLVICDGIGEFSDSGIVAKKIADKFLSMENPSLTTVLHDKELLELKNSESLLGGTTFISLVHSIKTNRVKIEYLGNGGIIHVYGDFNQNSISGIPYRYVHLMNPHVSQSGALTKHISTNSGKKELTPTHIELSLNYHFGDILILFSDGISSLENNIILKDEENRYWRNENNIIQEILFQLDLFLTNRIHVDMAALKEELIGFNYEVLNNLKKSNLLEDDASLGIVFTSPVIDYYKKLTR